MKLELATDMKPAGDQPKAIESLVKGINKGLGAPQGCTLAVSDCIKKPEAAAFTAGANTDALGL